MKIRKKPVDHVFDACNILLMVLVMLCTLYPFWYMIVGSFSTMGHLIKHGFVLWPDGLHLDAYRLVFQNALVPTAYRNTLLVTLGGTALSMLLTIVGAYVLTLRELPGRKALTMFFVFTMFFDGGLIPTYLLVNALGMIDTLWALFVPTAVNTYNMILMRNFFDNIPDSLYEAAEIEGESMLGYLSHILLPLSGAAIATISLFYAVGYWNDYFRSIIYIRNNKLWPMQTVLRQILQTGQLDNVLYNDAKRSIATETLQYAMITVTVLPILFVYPFIQKYFVKGVMVGSLKG